MMNRLAGDNLTTTASQQSRTRKIALLPGIGLAAKAPLPMQETGYDQGVPRASKHPADDHGETDKQHKVGEELIHCGVPFQRRS
jgi:hypothetical protein